MPAERQHGVPESVVGADEHGARWKRRVRIGVEGKQLVDREGLEPKAPQPAHVPLEDVRREVDPILARLPFARNPVVVEDDVRASRQPVPLTRRCDATNAAPERGVGGLRSHEGRRRSCPEDRTEDKSAEDPPVEPGAELQLRQEGRIGPEERHRRCAPSVADAQECGLPTRSLRVAPHELAAGTPDADGDRLGGRCAHRQPVRRIAQRRRVSGDFGDHGRVEPFEGMHDDSSHGQRRIELRR